MFLLQGGEFITVKLKKIVFSMKTFERLKLIRANLQIRFISV